MRKIPFFQKAIITLVIAMPFSGEFVSAQADPGNGNETIEALEQLDIIMQSMDVRLRYAAPAEDANIEAEYALEMVSQFEAKAEKQLAYHAPLHTDEIFDFSKDGFGNSYEAGYLTQVPSFNFTWLNLL